ncbi:XK-related protein 6 isoform X2 [Cryptotermes secundus]|uniref:XK-related protein 6 isoform X2 n=1 Tax=Cryptotermes secundus TaxID=105785 RepID=UPI000CD7DDAE|nr:XK-related protein 6 isoform X2 [Cryptotermes secundus]
MLTDLVADDKSQYYNKEEDVGLQSTVISSQVYAEDDVDFVPNNGHVTNFDILVLIVSIISHIIDIGLDINLAYRYFHSGRSEYSILTVIFILFPALVNTVISVRMYAIDKECNSVSKMASRKWVIRILVLLFQLAPVLRYCDSLSYALKSRRAEKQQDIINQRRFYEKMLKEDSDVAFLRVFECFLEAAPQQILQISILLVDTRHGSTFQWLHQAGSIISSLLSMAWSMASYHRSIRFVQEDKDNISWPGTVMQFLWHFMITVSRILSISLIATLFPTWTALACAVHWLVMTTWLSFLEQTKFCTSSQDSATEKERKMQNCLSRSLITNSQEVHT